MIMRFFFLIFFISSSEPKAQGEVLWSLTVRRRRRHRRRPSVSYRKL